MTAEWALMVRQARNTAACQDYLFRLQTRFGYTIGVPRTGRPVPVSGRGLPTWSAMAPIPGRVHHEPPLAVSDEWRALAAQGLRLRAAILAVHPDYPLSLLWPLGVLL